MPADKHILDPTNYIENVDNTDIITEENYLEKIPPGEQWLEIKPAQVWSNEETGRRTDYFCNAREEGDIEATDEAGEVLYFPPR